MRHPSLIPLSHDHHHGLALALRCRKQALGQLKPVGAEGLRERAREFTEFYESSLIAHFCAEEEVLFPLLAGATPEGDGVIAELVRHHREIGEGVARLKTGIGLAKLIFDLGDLLERHIRQEERKLFPLFEQHVQAAEADAVAEKLKKRLENRSS